MNESITHTFLDQSINWSTIQDIEPVEINSVASILQSASQRTTNLTQTHADIAAIPPNTWVSPSPSTSAVSKSIRVLTWSLVDELSLREAFRVVTVSSNALLTCQPDVISFISQSINDSLYYQSLDKRLIEEIARHHERLVSNDWIKLSCATRANRDEYCNLDDWYPEYVPTFSVPDDGQSVHRSCRFCRISIFNRFLSCPVNNYSLCVACYSVGRSCSCHENAMVWFQKTSFEYILRKHNMALESLGQQHLTPETLTTMQSTRNSPTTVAHILWFRKRSQLSIYCHQCKISRPFSHLIPCTSCFGSNKRRGFYCCACLWNRYATNMYQKLRLPVWQCPTCSGVCNCRSCLRDNGINDIQLVLDYSNAVVRFGTSFRLDALNKGSLVDTKSLAVFKDAYDGDKPAAVNKSLVIQGAHKRSRTSSGSLSLQANQLRSMDSHTKTVPAARQHRRVKSASVCRKWDEDAYDEDTNKKSTSLPSRLEPMKSEAPNNSRALTSTEIASNRVATMQKGNQSTSQVVLPQVISFLEEVTPFSDMQTVYSEMHRANQYLPPNYKWKFPVDKHLIQSYPTNIESCYEQALIRFVYEAYRVLHQFGLIRAMELLKRWLSDRES